MVWPGCCFSTIRHPIMAYDRVSRSQARGAMELEFRLLRMRSILALMLCFMLASAMVEDGTDTHESAGLAELDSGDGTAGGGLAGLGRGRSHRPRHAPQPVGGGVSRRVRRERVGSEADALFQRALHQTLVAGDEASRDLKEARGRVRASSLDCLLASHP